MHWLGLTLLCALCLASADAATKAWLQSYSAAQLTFIRFTLTGALLLPLLMDLPPLTSLPSALWGWLALLVPLEILAMWLYMRAIRDYPLSLTLPYLAFTPAWVSLVAWLLLDEQLTVMGGVGIAAIVIGAWLLHIEQWTAATWRDWLMPLRAIVINTGSRLMLMVATVYAVTATLGKAGLQYLPAHQFGALYFTILGAVTLLLLPLFYWYERRTINRPRVALWHQPKAVLTVAALNALMITTHFLALRQVEVAYMIAAKRSSLIFGVLYGIVLFKETGFKQRLAAASIMFGGVVCIAVFN